MASISTPALRASYAQETPTSAHISRKQQRHSLVYGTTASKPQATPTSTGSTTTQYRLPPVQEVVVRQSLKPDATAFPGVDQENVAPRSNVSLNKFKSSKRSILISSNNNNNSSSSIFTNDAFKASARMSLSARTDGQSSPASLRVVSQPSKTVPSVRHRQRHSSGEWWKIPQQAPTLAHTENRPHSESPQTVEMTPPLSLGRKKTTPVMGGPQQRLAPTLDLSQETVVQHGQPQVDRPSGSASHVFVEVVS